MQVNVTSTKLYKKASGTLGRPDSAIVAGDLNLTRNGPFCVNFSPTALLGHSGELFYRVIINRNEGNYGSPRNISKKKVSVHMEKVPDTSD